MDQRTDNHQPVDPASTGYGTLGGGETILPEVDLDSGAPVLVERHGPRFDGLAEVGRGALGQVLEARDLDIGRRVAIKRMRDDRRTRSAYLRFVQEVRTIGNLDHPNIVTVHDVGREEDGGLFFVMTYVDGESMEAVLDRLKAGDPETHAQWPFTRRLSVFRQVLHAMQFAHDRGVLHRDLKPANIMIGTHGEVRIVDWGVAKQIGAPDLAPEGDAQPGPVGETLAGSLVGTPRYMSPEQARGEPADVRSEVFALSVVAYEWFTLTHYLEDLDDVDRILTAIQTREIKNPMYVAAHGQAAPPPDLAWYVMDGLHKDPSRRYQAVAEMIERLDRRDQGELPIQCPATLQKSVLLRVESFSDRHPVLALLGAMTVPLGVAGGGAALALVSVLIGLGIGLAL
jgi:eukaryotic-like serine/threonine-protein kinase